MVSDQNKNSKTDKVKTEIKHKKKSVDPSKNSSFIQKILAIFNKPQKLSEFYKGHMGITEEQLDLDKKAKKLWLKRLKSYTTRTKKNDKERTGLFFRDIQTFTTNNDLFISFFWEDIWQGRLKKEYSEVEQICYKLIYKFLENNRDYFEKNSKMIFEELKNEDKKRRKFAEEICQEILKYNPKWLKNNFLEINKVLNQNFEYIQKTPMEEVKTKSHLKRRKKKKDSEKISQKDDQKVMIGKPLGFDFYFFLWTELLERYPDLIIKNWNIMHKWILGFEDLAIKNEKRAIRASINRISPTFLEYMMEMMMNFLDYIIEETNLPDELKGIKESLSWELVNLLFTSINQRLFENKPRLKERIVGLMNLYIHCHPSILQNYERISQWINQCKSKSLTFLIFTEIADQIIFNRDSLLVDLYFQDYLAHLSYGNGITIKKGTQMLYFIHNEMNYFSTPEHFKNLIFSLDLNEVPLHEHVLFLIFTLVRKYPELMIELKIVMEINLSIYSEDLLNNGIFFLKLLNELVIIYQGTSIVDMLYHQFVDFLMKPFSSSQVRYLIAQFFNLLTKKHINLLIPYREFIEQQIEEFASEFELKNIYSKIRIKIIRNGLILEQIKELE